jgi:hypothetical protein
MGKPKYCAHCGQLLPSDAMMTALEARLRRIEQQLQTIDMQDPRIGAEGWADTIRRIARDVLRQEGR